MISLDTLITLMLITLFLFLCIVSFLDRETKIKEWILLTSLGSLILITVIL